MGELTKIKLSRPQRLWLETAYSKSRKGESVSARSLILELRGKLPAGFNPSEIDSRLLHDGFEITLLGIALVEPRSEIVTRADLVLQGIRNFLAENSEATVIDVYDISHLTGIPNRDVAGVFGRLSQLGVFHNSGTGGYGPDGWSSININEQAFAGFMSYETLGQLLKNLFDENDKASPDEPAPQPEAEPRVGAGTGRPVTKVSLNGNIVPPREFILNQPMDVEETRHAEFKEITGRNPANTIKDIADQYAVAFLNREGGTIYWGVRDTDRVVVGVKFEYSQRDLIRREVCVKLAQINPPVPVSAFSCEIHQVFDERRNAIPDLHVCVLTVPPGSAGELYSTGSGAVFIKTDGGKQKLSTQQVIVEAARRRTAAEGQNSPVKQDCITKSQARAWLDNVIHKVQEDLERERFLLSKYDWTWRHRPPAPKLEAICYVVNHRVERKNFRRLLMRYPRLSDEVATHDRLVDALTVACGTFQLALAESTEMSDVFHKTTSHESLTKLMDHHLLKGYTINDDEQIKEKVLGRRPDAERINRLAEYIVNNWEELPFDHIARPFWENHGQEFFDLLRQPVVREVSEETRKIGEELLESVSKLINLFEEIADEICSKTGEPPVPSSFDSSVRGSNEFYN